VSARSALPVRERWSNRSLFRLIWPLVVEQLLAVTMGAADTIMVSPVGEFAVSGVNIIDNINHLLIIAFIALSTGGAVVCSQYIGRQDFENARIASKQLVYIVTLVSLVITVFSLMFRRPVISAIYGKIEDDVMNAAMIYLLITALSFPFLAVYNSCAALFRSAGNSQVPMKIALMVNIINIGGNALFLYVIPLGIAGVALSTLLSRIAAAVILMIMLIKRQNSPISLTGIQKVKILPSMTRRILNIGIPSGLEQSMFQLGRLLTQRIFPVFGTSVIAANAVASTINSFGFMTGNAYTMALLTVVGQCIGAGDYEGAKKYAAKIIKITWITISSICATLFIFRTRLVMLFNLTPEAQATATSFLAVHTVSSALVWTLSFAYPSALRAAGDAKYVMIIGVISMWTVRVCFAYLLTFVFGVGPLGVWIAQGGDFVFRGIFYASRWKGGRWQRIKLLD
jgi:putative MATE family efflux protein